jgi:hypothetical protein
VPGERYTPHRVHNFYPMKIVHITRQELLAIDQLKKNRKHDLERRVIHRPPGRKHLGMPFT